MFKTEMHAHTSEVSPCSHISAEELVRLYSKAGYNGLTITDHFNRFILDNIGADSWEDKVTLYYKGYDAAVKCAENIPGFRIFCGMELKLPENSNEYLLHGLDKEFFYKNEYLYERDLAEIKRLVNEAGGIIVQAHPFRSVCTPKPAELLDGVEVFNGHFGHNSHNDKAFALGKEYGKLMLSGSDCHYHHGVGNGGIIFEREPEDDNLAKALREIPYELIRTEPQWLNAVFAGGKTKNIERIAGMRGAQVVINMDEKAQECESCLTLCAPKEYGKIHIINRFQIVFGMEALADLCETEPSILVCDELSDDDRERAAELGVLFVVSNKSDDKRPYKESDTTFIGLDMLRRGFCGFGVQFMAEDIEISELTK